MALEDYVGSVVMEIDSVEVEIAKFSVKETTGYKAVKTMNRKMRVRGVAAGIREFTLSVTAVVPLVGGVDWANIKGAKITIYPAIDGGKRTSYIDCFTLEVSDEYSVDNEAVRDLSMQALDKVEE